MVDTVGQTTFLVTPVQDEPHSDALDGPAGWVVVVAAFLSMFAVFGVSYSFGAILIDLQEDFGISKAAAAWFPAIATFLYFSIGIFTGRLADRHGPRPVLLAGAGALTAGMVATASVDDPLLACVTYSLGVGFGVAAGYVPMVAAVGGWFERRRTTALGLAVAGIGMGTLVGARLTDRLAELYGWRSAFQAIGIGAGVLLLLAALLARRPPGSGTGSVALPVRTLAGNRQFRLLYLGMFLTSVILFLPFVFLDDQLTSQGSPHGPLLIGVIGAMSVIGRLGIGALASRVPLSVLYLSSCAMVPLTFLLWLAAGTNLAALAGFAALMGVSYGGFIALAPAVTAGVFGPEGLGGVLGLLYTSAGIGGLVGPPAAGRLEGIIGYPATILAAVVIGLTAVPVLWVVARSSTTSA